MVRAERAAPARSGLYRGVSDQHDLDGFDWLDWRNRLLLRSRRDGAEQRKEKGPAEDAHGRSLAPAKSGGLRADKPQGDRMTNFETAAGIVVGALFFVLVIAYAFRPMSTEMIKRRS